MRSGFVMSDSFRNVTATSGFWVSQRGRGGDLMRRQRDVRLQKRVVSDVSVKCYFPMGEE